MKAPVISILWTNIVYSLLSHKEFRFVLPVLPLALIYAGNGLCQLYAQYQKRKLFIYTVTFLLLLNVPIALYLSLFHQLAPVSVMSYVRGLNESNSLHYLMPCHSTPYFSHVHKNISMKFWDCSPSDEIGYIDQADQFKADPLGFVTNYYDIEGDSTKKSPLPSHFILFDQYLPKLKKFFDKIDYHECQRYFYKHDFDLDGSFPFIITKNVLVFCKDGKT